MKGIKQARDNFGADMRNLFDVSEYEKNIKDSKQKIKNDKQTLQKVQLALTWDGDKK